MQDGSVCHDSQYCWPSRHNPNLLESTAIMLPMPNNSNSLRTLPHGEHPISANGLVKVLTSSHPFHPLFFTISSGDPPAAAPMH